MNLPKKIGKNRKAISQVTAIIIVVVIAASVTVAGWMMGLWLVPTEVEALEITRECALEAASKTFLLVVRNTGTLDASITNIRVVGADVANPSPSYPIIVKAGATAYITGAAPIPGICNRGEPYDFQVYTAAGNVYSEAVIAT